MATLRVSIEATGDYADEAATHVATFVSLVEGATPYVRPPEHFLTQMVAAPCLEKPDESPHFSIFINVLERPTNLLASLVALRVNANNSAITSCVAHQTIAIQKDDLRDLCKNFVRVLADNRGGLRWQHKYDQLIRDVIDP